jgi:uncharacterized protein (DUF952 family)
MAELPSKGSFAGAPVDLADGYIHLSAQDQVAGTLAKWFAGQEDLHLAAVDLAALGDVVKWEEARGGALFPHIYGPLPSPVLAMPPAMGRRRRADSASLALSPGLGQGAP